MKGSARSARDDVTLVPDAHTAGDKTKYGAPPVEQVITHTNLYWGTQTAPGRTAAAVTAAEVEVSTEGHP